MKKHSNRLNDGFDAFDEKLLEKSLKALDNEKKGKRDEVTSKSVKRGEVSKKLASKKKSFDSKGKLKDKSFKKGDVNQKKDVTQKTEGKRKKATDPNSCPIFKKCGACQFLDQPYDEHLKEKQKHVESLLKSHGKVNTILGMKSPYHYRNKVQAVFTRDARGNIISGQYKEGTHQVIPIETCLIEDQKADEIIGTIRGMLKSFKIKTYDEDTGYGLLRYVLVKRGFTSNEIMVVLVIGSPIFPSKNNFVKALRAKHPEITTIVLNINDRTDSLVLGNRETVLYGKGYIEDTLCGNVFRISSRSFYQVNPVQTEALYKKAIDLAGFTGKETIVDAYCGIGTIGLVAAKHVKEVISVELNKDAYKDAIANAKRNEIKNVRFYNADASEFMTKLAAEDLAVDVVMMDPPRSGSTEQFIDAVASLAPKKVVYISCNPVTLERDISYFQKQGYEMKEAWPVDMFPWTQHVETVVLLTRTGR